MPRFEVFCPASPPRLPADVTLQLDAENWLAALKAGVVRLGGTQPSSHILCDVQADGSIHVAEPQGGGVFRIRELREPPPAAPSAPVVPSVVATAAPAAVAPPRPAPKAPAAPPAAAPASPAQRPQAPAAAAAPPAARAQEVPATAAPAASAERQAGLERILELAMAKVDAEAGSVLLTRASGRELEFVVVRGPKAKQLVALFALRGAVPVSDGVVGYCVREGVALAVSDARKDRRHLWDVSVAIDYETRSILCAPIARKGHVLGALEVLNKRGGAPFDARDLAALSELAREAAEHLARHGG